MIYMPCILEYSLNCEWTTQLVIFTISICRPDTSSIMTPYDSTSPKNVYNEDEEDPLPLDTVVDSQSNVDTFPPRFTSLVSSCSAEQEKGRVHPFVLKEELHSPSTVYNVFYPVLQEIQHLLLYLDRRILI